MNLAPGLFIAPLLITKLNLRRRELLARASSPILRRKELIAHKTLCILKTREEAWTWKKSPSALWLRRFPARRSPLPWVQINSQLLKTPKSRDYQERKHARLNSSPETSDGALLKQSNRKIDEQCCRRHLIQKILWFATNSKRTQLHRGEHSLCQNIRQMIRCWYVFYHDRMIQSRPPKKPIQIDPVHFSDVPKVWRFVLCWSLGSRPHCLRKCKVGLGENCWGCWVEQSQWIQTCDCQCVNETERLVRVCDVQSFPWLSYWTMFPKHTPIIEELGEPSIL